MAKNCNRCGRPLAQSENYYCEDCRQIVRQEYLDKEKNPKSEQSRNDNPSVLSSTNTWASSPANPIGTALKICGFIYIGLAVIWGFIVGESGSYCGEAFNWSVALPTIFVGSVAGLLIAGIGEIILLLQGSNDKLIAMIRMTEEKNIK